MRRVIMATVIAIALVGAHAATASADVTEYNLEITSAILIDPTDVRIMGVITCDAPTVVGFIGVSLQQRGGAPGFRSGTGRVEQNACEPTGTQFLLHVIGGPFHPGRATFTASGFACDQFDQCASDQSSGTLRITPPPRR